MATVKNIAWLLVAALCAGLLSLELCAAGDGQVADRGVKTRTASQPEDAAKPRVPSVEETKLHKLADALADPTWENRIVTLEAYYVSFSVQTCFAITEEAIRDNFSCKVVLGETILQKSQQVIAALRKAKLKPARPGAVGNARLAFFFYRRDNDSLPVMRITLFDFGLAVNGVAYELDLHTRSLIRELIVLLPEPARDEIVAHLAGQQ